MSGLSRERLERLLGIRRAGEGAARGRWARARREAQARRADTEAVAAKGDTLAAEMRDLARGLLDLARLQAAEDGRQALARRAGKLDEAARAAEHEADANRRRLEEANRGVRAMEKLSDRRAAEERARGLAREARENDDRRRP